MCGYCCGGVPVAQRGEAHKGCSAECYNALSTRQMRYVRRAEDAEARLSAATLTLAAWLTESQGERMVPISALRDVAAALGPDHGCPTEDCKGDVRYPAPGRGHREGCTYPT